MSMEVKNEGVKYKKPSAVEVIGGVMAGSLVNNLVTTPTKLISPRLMYAMGKVNDSLTKDEFQHLQEGISKAFDKTKLASKGVSILRATEENSAQVEEVMKGEFSKGILKNLPEKFREFYGSMIGKTLTDGQNACYVSTAKKIILPEQKLNLAFFHEAGHALNANMSTIGKLLQKNRNLCLLAAPIALISLYKTKKAEGEEPKNKVDKATNFVKHNAWKLTFAVYVPSLIEEGMATIQGNKLAKEFLNKDLAKKVAKTNAFGYMTYLLLAVATSTGIHFAVKIKDKIAYRDEIKTEN